MSVQKKASSMGVAVMLSRVLGLVREQVFAFFFGASAVSDAFWVAFRIPNLFRDLLAEGALSSAFVKVFAAESRDQRSKQLARLAARALTFVLGVLILLLMIGAPWFVPLLAQDFARTPGKLELTISLTQLLTPFLFFASLAALSAGILNTKGYFFLPATAPLFFNLSSALLGGTLAWWWSADPAQAIVGFALGTLFGGFLQWMVQWPLLLRLGYSPLAGVMGFAWWPKLKQAFADPGVKEMFLLMAPAIMGVASVQINVLINTFWAASLQTGSVTWLNFAYRFLHLPLGLFGVTLAVASLPHLVRLLKTNKIVEFRNSFEDSLSWGFLLGVGATGGLMVLGDAIISLVYQYGQFGEFDTQMTSAALRFYAVGLIAFIVQKILVSAFYALSKPKIPMFVSLLSIGFNILGAWILVPHLQHVGLALSTSISIWLQVVILLVIIHRQVGTQWSLRTVKTLLAAALGAGIFLAYHFIIGDALMSVRLEKGLFTFALHTLGTVAILGLSYLGIIAWLRPRK